MRCIESWRIMDLWILSQVKQQKSSSGCVKEAAAPNRDQQLYSMCAAYLGYLAMTMGLYVQLRLQQWS